MKRQKAKYERPRRPWDKERLEYEKEVCKTYGIRRKKELWRAEEILRGFRRRARILEASKDMEGKKVLIDKLCKLGFIDKAANLDDVLALSVENLLDRRIETIIFKKGIAKTPKQARQFIVHGHVTVEGRRVRWPSLLLTTDQEPTVALHPKSKMLWEKQNAAKTETKPEVVNVEKA